MSDINFVGGIIMKLREVLKIISILSNLKEGEKIYLSNKRGYILKTGKFCGFDENKNIIYEPKYTKEEFTEIQYNIALDILMGIEIAHKLLNCVPDMPNIDLYNSDISVDKDMSNLISVKSRTNNHLVLTTYWQSDIHGFEMRVFDIDLVNYFMVLHILEGNNSSPTMDYYTSSGNLSEKSILVINREINGENRQSTLNTSYDMYFEDCSGLNAMIEKVKKSNPLKKEKLLNRIIDI